MARRGQPTNSKLGRSKSPRFLCVGLSSIWSLGEPAVLTHTQWGLLGTRFIQLSGDADPVSAYSSTKDKR